VRGRSVDDLAAEMAALAKEAAERSQKYDPDEFDRAAHLAKRLMDVAQTFADDAEHMALSMRFTPLNDP
jgi:hypothetical protein